MDALRVLAVIPGSEDGEGFIFARRQILMLRKLGVDVEAFFLGERTRLWGLVCEAVRYRRKVRAWQPHVVHSHYGTVTALFCIALSFCPVVITYRGTDLNPSSEFSRPRATISRLMSQAAACFARRIICVSEELNRRLWCRRRRANAHVLPTGVNLDEFYPLGRDAARQKLGWALSERLVLFNHGASKAPNKRLDLANAAVALVKRELQDVRLVVLEGDISGAEMPLYLNAADALLMTSDYEGSPNIVKEALACNVPICSVDVGDVSRMIQDVRECVLVERDPVAIARGLSGLLERGSRSNGREVQQRYSADALTRQLLTVLCSAADY